MKQVTCSAPVNIAVIKYWGKRDENLILPVNSSLSGTLNQKDLRTVTTASTSPEYTEDELWLNGELRNVFAEIRRRAGVPPTTYFRAVSINNFPTAAGLASSASGFACLAFTLATLFGIADQEITTIARVGSGSACRSIYGGFVKWEMGVKDDGSDSIALQVADEKHWPEIQILVCVVSDHKKAVSSTAGMQDTVRTSPRMKERVHVVPQRMRDMEKAILERNFAQFAELTMTDSNDFHSCCADTTPPIFYMNDTSKKIVQLIEAYNKSQGEIKAAYTFDAGPNAVIYLPAGNVPEVLALLHHYFPPSAVAPERWFRDQALLATAAATGAAKAVTGQVNFEPIVDGLKYVLHTSLGPGPQALSDAESLIDEHGRPKQ